MLPLSPSHGMLELMLALMLGVSLELSLTRRLIHPGQTRPRIARVWTLLCAPLLRGAVIVGAVLWTYPALFGFRVAPPLMPLLLSDGASHGALLCLVVLARLLVPLLAPLRRRPDVVDCAQGFAATALVFAAYADHLGALSATVWPGIVSVLALGGMSMLLPPLAAGLARDFATRWGVGAAAWLGQLSGMAAVAPIVMLYGYLLGMQLAM